MAMKIKWQKSDLLAVLGLVFVVMKSEGHLDWPWWLVTVPFWVVLATAFVVGFLEAVAKNRREHG
jgi:uncharacterized integral membrane protein